jgi:hypothetical protein
VRHGEIAPRLRRERKKTYDSGAPMARESAARQAHAECTAEEYVEAGGIPGGYWRVVTAITPPMLPVPNFVVASQER